MLSRKTQYAWMAVGGLICLFGLALACKLRDGNKAIAQPEPPPPIAVKEPSPSIFTLPPTLQVKSKEPEMLPPPKKVEKSKDQASKSKATEPKATLHMPMPLDPPSLELPSAAKSPPPPSPSALMPTSFGSSSPAPLDEKKASKPASGPPPLPAPAPVMSGSFRSSSTAPMGEKKASKPAPLPPPSLPPPSSSFLPYNAANLPDKRSEPAHSSWNAPATVTPASAVPAPMMNDSAKMQPGEPPLAPAPGPVQIYRVRGTETLHDIARRTLGSSERWSDLQKLNPALRPDEPLHAGARVRLPADACIQTDDAEPVKALPVLRSKPPAPKAKALPLTGTYQCSLDDKGRMTLPRAIRDQLGSSDTVLLSPGPDKCLWLTNHTHLERLGERLDQSQANEADVRVFKRLYFAQTEKLTVNSDGRVTIPERLGQFAGLHQEVVLVGIDDHFEVWDAAHWRAYTQQKSAGHSAAMAEQE